MDRNLQNHEPKINVSLRYFVKVMKTQVVHAWKEFNLMSARHLEGMWELIS